MMLMMMLFPITLSFCFWRQMSAKSATFLLSLSLYLMHLISLPPMLYNMNSVISSDCLLTDMDALLVFMTTAVMLLSFFVIVSSNTVFTKCHWFMYLNLVLIFVLKKTLTLYVLMELSLAPISLIILGWGYQPERSIAFLYMFIYTLTAFLPFLVIIIQWWNIDYFSVFIEIWSFSAEGAWPPLSVSVALLASFLILGFMVKFPLYSLHLWLPKAHVEAPISGSMILAGALLKLGGFGWYLIMGTLEGGPFLKSLTVYAGLGGALVSVLCLRQVDMKVIIAYSSVGHLSLAIMAFSNSTTSGYMGGLMILIVHGFSSPGMFYGANTMYTRSGSRSILMNPSLLSFSPFLSLFWFILCMANMSAPPSSNLMAEVVSINSVVSSNTLSAYEIAALVFLSGAYTLILYSSSQQGQKKSAFWWLLPLTLLELMTFFLVASLVYGVVFILMIT